MFPLYYTVLFTGTAFLLVSHHGEAYRELSQRWGSPSWFALYAGNLRIAFLDRMPTAEFLIPLWSLQIEEQFYLLFPFLVRKVKPLLLFRLLICVVALAGPMRWAISLWKPNLILVQYVFTGCRLDGLACGALVALWLRGANRRIWRPQVLVITVALLGALSGYLGWGDYSWSDIKIRTLGYSLCALTFAGVLLSALHCRDTWQTGWLRVGPVRYLGKISYGIYLLQFPVCMVLRKLSDRWGSPLFADGAGAHTKTWEGFILLAGLTIAAASLSWYALEGPLVRAKDRLTTPGLLRDENDDRMGGLLRPVGSNRSGSRIG